MTHASPRIAWIVLVTLLAVQAVLVAGLPPSPFVGDEPYYVNKARYFAEHGTFPRVSAAARAAEAGAGGDSDWRPPGYPLFVAAVSGGNFEPETLRPRVAAVQFLGVALVAVTALACLSTFAGGRTMLVAALVLGAAPWPFDFVSLVGADSLNATVSFFGLIALWRWTRGAGGCAGLFGASLLFSSAFLLRPEMIAVVPLPIAVAVILRTVSLRSFLRLGATAAAAFLCVVAAQYAYRTHLIGRVEPSLFGGLHIYNAGAFAWVHSWVGTEDEAYDFVYELPEGGRRTLPARAFRDEEERRAVDALRDAARRQGYTVEIDRAFGELAARRRRDDPFFAIVVPRLWHAMHLYLNLETNDQLLHALRRVPRTPRRGLIGLLLGLKVALLAAFAVKTARLLRGRWRAMQLPALLASFVVARTVLVGLILDWMPHRYALMCWMPLIVVALWPFSERGATEESPVP